MIWIGAIAARPTKNRAFNQGRARSLKYLKIYSAILALTQGVEIN
jgi:hypothetical protein